MKNTNLSEKTFSSLMQIAIDCLRSKDIYTASTISLIIQKKLNHSHLELPQTYKLLFKIQEAIIKYFPEEER